MSQSMLFSRHLQTKDFRRAGFALITAVFSLAVLVPVTALAGPGGKLGLKSSLQNVVAYLQSDVAKFAMFIALMGVLAGIIFRSQRSESIGGLAAIAGAFVVLLNVQGIFSILGVTTASPMASESALSTHEALPVVQEAFLSLLC